MKTYQWSSEGFWYINKMPLYLRILNSIVLFGGWLSPTWTNKGEYTYKWKFYIPSTRLTKKGKVVDSKIWRDPYPLTLFGCITFFGSWMSIRHKRATTVISWQKRGYGKSRLFQAYTSANGTPSRAHIWYFGTPMEVKRSVELPEHLRSYANN